MAVKTILVPILDAQSGRGAVSAAFLVAQPFNAHVVGLDVSSSEVTAENIMHSRAALGMAGQEMQEFLLRSVDHSASQGARDRRAMFEGLAREMHAETTDRPALYDTVTATFATLRGGADAVARKGHFFDLVVVTQPRSDPDHKYREIVRAVLFGSGRPVLVVREDPPQTIGERLLIAWNESPLAARAAAISRQHFLRAKEVCVLSVIGGRRASSSAKNLADYLAWHGITSATVREAELGEWRLGDVILQEVNAFGADLLVMGAYSQSPFRESLTGGVTNHILSHTEVPVLMTH